ncbi:MAG: ATP-binding protein [Candidatus Magnetoglobus multicellularis str. Araruama]|uniref:ATP-binding protein n=1 Tax=Candidatus Magnetoglobus multicellularis str. Araruama TaxID=890399 RepID=A0A1V1PFG0_9BACT|nr:MAG: ATP-binding protein [Candidatus Magnetoglobus multicellularis str. Araruama]
MNRSALKSVILDQENIYMASDWVKRDKFNEISSRHDEPFISIISGIRRCGKSTLLFQLKGLFDGYYLNFDDDRLVGFTVEDFQCVDEIFHELYGEKSVYYFDEIQNIDQWERFVRRLHQSNKKVYITGSNARLLSKELGTHLTGRYVENRMYPFSFSEYLNLKKITYSSTAFFLTKEKSKLLSAFHEYFISGGMPEYLQTNNPGYIKSLYESILYRDILVRYHIDNEKAMKELFLFAFSNIGKPISFNKLKNMLSLKSTTTIKNYFDYFENNFVVFLLSKYSHSLKKNIYANKKMYVIDNSFSNLLGFRSTDDHGRFLENIVFIEMLRHGEDIYYYQEKNECDFIVKKGTQVLYAVQVCYELNERNKAREFNGLLDAMKAFQLKTGYILTFADDDQVTIDELKVIIMPVWKFCLNFYKGSLK